MTFPKPDRFLVRRPVLALGMLLSATCAAQTVNIRGSFNGWRDAAMSQNGAAYDRAYRGLTPGSTVEFQTAGTGGPWPATNVRTAADRHGVLHARYAAGPFSDGWSPSANRVGYDDPGTFAWEIVGSFNGFASQPQAQMSYQGAGVWAVDYAFNAAATHSLRFRRSGDATISIGADFGSLSPNATFSAAAGDVLRFELDLPNGRWRVSQAPRVLYVSPTGNDANNGRTWFAAKRQVYAAMSAAAGDLTITRVMVAAGNYPVGAMGAGRAQTITLRNGLSLLGGFEIGDVDPALARPAKNVCAISGDLLGDDVLTDWTAQSSVPFYMTDNVFHVVTAGPGLNASAVMDGFTIRAGSASGGVPAQQQGAGIVITAATPTIRRCSFERNWSSGIGAGAFVSGAAVGFDSCTFAGNVALNGGGGVYFDGAACTGTVVNCVFSANRVNAPGEGGAIHMASNAALTIASSTFASNFANLTTGGVYSASAANSFRIVNCVLWLNTNTQNLLTRQQQIFRAGDLANDISYCIVQGWNLGGATNRNVDPLLVDRDGPDNTLGTLDDDLRLVPNSPAIDFGDANADISAAQPGTQAVGSTDLEGFPRRVDVTPGSDAGNPRILDQGAHEFAQVLFVDASAGPGGNGRTWRRALSSLDSALLTPGVGSHYREILVAGGTYVPTLRTVPADSRSAVFSMIANVALRGGFRNGQSLAEREPGRIVSILSGDISSNDGETFANPAENAYKVVRAVGAGTSAVLDGFLIRYGNANTGSNSSGAAIFVDGGATLRDCAIRQNTATGGGAGIAHIAGTLDLARCGLSNNTAGGAAAIHSTAGTVSLADCGVRTNLSNALAAINVANAISLALDAVDLIGNTGLEYAALCASEVPDSTLSNVDILDNTSGIAALHITTASQADLTAASLRYAGNTATAENGTPNGLIEQIDIDLAGDLEVVDAALELRSCSITGASAIELQTGALLIVGAVDDTPAAATLLAASIRGDGDVLVRRGQKLRIDNGGCLNLSGSSNCTCASLSDANLWGDVTLLGALEVAVGTLRSCDILVDNKVSGSSAGSCGNWLGGRLVALNGAAVECNRITAHGDRYLVSVPGAITTISGNEYHVIIDPDPLAPRGEVLQARCASLSAADPWALESLTLLPGAKLNVVYRSGYGFLGGGDKLYVKNLTIQPGAVLNITPQVDFAYNPATFVGNASQIVGTPLLGFSLETITMEDSCEFSVRIASRVTVGMETGVVRRIETGVNDNGVMEMSTVPMVSPAAFVAAKGTFGGATEPMVTIDLLYRFMQTSSTTRIDVILSDQSDPTVGGRRVARIRPPAPTSPGGTASTQMARFFGEFPRGSLDLSSASYIEMRLIGPGARVWVDDFDPFITCVSNDCGDYTGDGAENELDYLVSLSTIGVGLQPNDLTQQRCFDKNGQGDGLGDLYADAFDLLIHDAMYGFGIAAGEQCRPLPRTSYSSGDVSSRDFPGSLLMAASRRGNELDRPSGLFPLTSSGASAGAVQDPPGPASFLGFQRGWGRLLRGPTGNVCQLHVTQNLVDVSQGVVLLAPQTAGFAYAGSRTAYVGLTTVGNAVVGVPISDAAFDPTDADRLFVTPVYIEPAIGHPYLATASLRLLGDGSCTLEQLFGRNPAELSNVLVEDMSGRVVYDPDEFHPRELEIASDGTLFVTSVHAVNDNDWLLAFNTAQTGAAGEEPDLRTCVSATLEAPSCLLWTGGSAESLYMTTSINQDDDAAIVHRFGITRNVSGAVSAVALGGSVSVNMPATHVGSVHGQRSGITALASTTNGSIAAAGFIMPIYESTDEISDWNTSHADPVFAVLPTSGSVNATSLANNDADAPALPISLLSLCGGCAEDANCDGQRNLTDLAVLLANFGAASGASQATGDVDGDGDVDLTDLARLLSVFGLACP